MGHILAFRKLWASFSSCSPLSLPRAVQAWGWHREPECLQFQSVHVIFEKRSSAMFFFYFFIIFYHHVYSLGFNCLDSTVTRPLVLSPVCWAKALQTVYGVLRSTAFSFRLRLVFLQGFSASVWQYEIACYRTEVVLIVIFAEEKLF